MLVEGWDDIEHMCVFFGCEVHQFHFTQIWAKAKCMFDLENTICVSQFMLNVVTRLTV